MSPLISVVVPVYECEKCLQELAARLDIVLSEITSNFEVILVNDASPDNVWLTISQLASKDNRFKGLELSRNFGQHAAITAGLDAASGDWIVVMDCDLQDSPEEIPRLYEMAMTGKDLVVALRMNRTDGFFKKMSSKLFWKFFKLMNGHAYDHRCGNFGIYSKKVIDSIQMMREQTRGFGFFTYWVGFNRAEVEVLHEPRWHGKSSYTFNKMVGLAIDIVTSHSDGLLKLTVKAGFLLALFSMIFGLWMVIRYYIWSIPVVGWTSLIISVYFTSGLIMGAIGISGLYIGKIFNEVKRRPIYIVKATTFEVDNEPKIDI